MKSIRQAEYNVAMEYVESVYEENDIPYTEEHMNRILTKVRDLAPSVKLDRAWLLRILKHLKTYNPEQHAMTRTAEQWRDVFPLYPTTSDGFVKSCDPHDEDTIREMFNTYGLVVVQVFPVDVCEATVEAMFEEINAMAPDSEHKKVDVAPDVHTTWENCNWPSRSKFLIPRPAFHPQSFANRTHDNVYAVFAALWQETRLRVSIDNWGVARGSTNLLLADEQGEFQSVERRKWGKGIRPHWDYNPWLLVDEMKKGHNPGYQAVVALNEHTSGMGCHLTLPGCLPFLPQWCGEHARPIALGKKRQSHRPDEDDPIRQYMQEIPLRQGEMLVWSWGQLHATDHNVSDQIRLHQYIRMFPAHEVDPFYEEHDRYAPERIARQYPEELDLESLDLNDRGRKLFGLSPWG